MPESAQQPLGNGERRVPAAPAAGTALPSLLKDNCIGKQNRKSRFVAQENIRLYIERSGINNVGVLTITTPDSCLNAFQFQKKWHSFRTNVLKERFPTGMWARERQPRSGNWHAHCVVALRRDIKTTFPFQEVQRRNYRNVDPQLRSLWKELREKGAGHGFGRIELLPIKRSGPGGGTLPDEVSRSGARLAEISWGREMPALRNMGRGEICSFSIQLGKQSHVSQAESVAGGARWRRE